MNATLVSNKARIIAVAILFVLAVAEPWEMDFFMSQVSRERADMVALSEYIAGKLQPDLNEIVSGVAALQKSIDAIDPDEDFDIPGSEWWATQDDYALAEEALNDPTLLNDLRYLSALVRAYLSTENPELRKKLGRALGGTLSRRLSPNVVAADIIDELYAAHVDGILSARTYNAFVVYAAKHRNMPIEKFWLEEFSWRKAMGFRNFGKVGVIELHQYLEQTFPGYLEQIDKTWPKTGKGEPYWLK